MIWRDQLFQVFVISLTTKGFFQDPFVFYAQRNILLHQWPRHLILQRRQSKIFLWMRLWLAKSTSHGGTYRLHSQEIEFRRDLTQVNWHWVDRVQLMAQWRHIEHRTNKQSQNICISSQSYRWVKDLFLIFIEIVQLIRAEGLKLFAWHQPNLILRQISDLIASDSWHDLWVETTQSKRTDRSECNWWQFSKLIGTDGRHCVVGKVYSVIFIEQPKVCSCNQRHMINTKSFKCWEVQGSNGLCIEHWSLNSTLITLFEKCNLQPRHWRQVLGDCVPLSHERHLWRNERFELCYIRNVSNR